MEKIICKFEDETTQVVSTTTNNRLPRYRTIKTCLAEIQRLDRDTAITEWFIRQLCKDEKVAYHASGNKSLVSLDNLLSYLGYDEAD